MTLATTEIVAAQIAATTGLTVLTQADMALWSILRDLGLIEPNDELVVRNILASPGQINTIKIDP